MLADYLIFMTMKQTLLLFAVITVLSACNAQKTADCPNVMCTQDFRYITVKLLSGSGGEPDMKNYEVKFKSSGKKLNSNPGPDAAANPNTLVIADDSNLKELSPKGDVMILSIRRNDGSSIDVPYTISGGVCNCHVSKVSGPDEIDTDRKAQTTNP